MADEKRQPVVQGKVSITDSPKTSFFAKDAKDVGSFLWKDRIIPGIKKFVYDIIMNGLHMSLFGSGTNTSGGSGYSAPYQQVSFRGYDSPYKPVQQPSSQQQKPPVPSGLNYDRFVFETRGDAEAVLMQMSDIVEEYGMVRVSDLYDLVGRTPPVTAHDYGWKAIAESKVTVCSEGFTIIFPKANPLK